MMVSFYSSRIFGYAALLVVLCFGSCRPLPSYTPMAQALWPLKAEERWQAISSLRQDYEHPSLRLLAVAAKNDHISRIQALLLLSEVKWEPGVRERLLDWIMADKDALVRAAAAYVLPLSRQLSAQQLQQLHHTLSDPSWHVRRYILRALLELETSRSRLVQVCQKLLQDPHPAVRWDAILCWRRHQIHRKDGAQHLAPLLKDANPRVQRLTIQSLGWWGDSALPVLSESLKDAAEEVRCNALSALSSFRHSFARFVPWIVEAMQDSSESVQACAVRTLAQLVPYTDLALQPLAQSTLHRQMLVALDAISALRQIGERAQISVPILRRVYFDPKQPIFKRYEATQAVLQILSDPKSPIRQEAVSVQNMLSPLIKDTLFQRTSEVLGSSVEVSFLRVWTPLKYVNDLIYLIRKDYLADLQTCNLSSSTGKPLTKTFWVELFIERHGEVVLPFVFSLDRKREIAEPCLVDHFWSWQFPRLLSERYAYIQFQLKLEPAEDGRIQINPDGGSSPGILIK